MLSALIHKYIRSSSERFTFGKARYMGFKIIVIKENGYVNASSLCFKEGKKYDLWLEEPLTKSLFEELSLSGKARIIHISNAEDQVSGYYIHESLVMHLAFWLSPKLAIETSLANISRTTTVVNGITKSLYEIEQDRKIAQLFENTELIISEFKTMKEINKPLVKMNDLVYKIRYP